MRVKARFRSPLILTSKTLCISLLYLFTSLFIALYASLSSTKCIFRSSPFDPIQTPLFSYPSTYGVHKYAIPTVRSSCVSPLYFSDYWVVMKEMNDLLQNSSYSSYSDIGYITPTTTNGDSFGGNFSIQERISYFNQTETRMIPCGFQKEFPLSDYDKSDMEKCTGVVVVSAIFGDHDKIRQPRGLGSKTLETVGFFMFVDDHTFNTLNSHRLLSNNEEHNNMLGAWRMVRVSGLLPYDNPAMNGVIPKHLVHRLFPNSRFSIWVDAKIQLTVDPLLLIHSLIIKEDADMAISKHPYYMHTMEEAMATARWKKWGDVDSLKVQMETYCEYGLQPWTPQKLPYTSDVPDSAIIIRRHGVKSNLFSCLLFNELEGFNPRDQLAFAFVRDQMIPKMKLNMFEVEVFEQIAIEYRHNIKHGGENPPVTKQYKSIRANGNKNDSRCEGYLLKMWGQSHE